MTNLIAVVSFFFFPGRDTRYSPLSVSLNDFKMWTSPAVHTTPLTSAGETFTHRTGLNTTAPSLVFERSAINISHHNHAACKDVCEAETDAMSPSSGCTEVQRFPPSGFLPLRMNLV